MKYVVTNYGAYNPSNYYLYISEDGITLCYFSYGGQIDRESVITSIPRGIEIELKDFHKYFNKNHPHQKYAASCMQLVKLDFYKDLLTS